MSALIRSTELLDVARVLTPSAAGPGRPRTAQLRRAVSTAYYAVFHELVVQATVALCGNDPQGAAARHQAARWFTHSDLRVLAKATTSAGGAARAVASVLGSPHQDLARLVDLFVALQSERYRADYDHEYSITRSAALSLIDDAGDAIDTARRLAMARDGSYQRFLKLMLGSVKIARMRDT
jgi:hypothetical protein